jgi:23S rRNA pseudouridine2605 synthase
MNHKKVRIAKLLANYNYGSRREIERLIKESKIKLNNKVIFDPVTFADDKDEIYIDGKKVIFKKKILILKFYKPKDVMCSKNKQDNRKIIYEILDSKYKNFIFAGRLDFKSEGLMILTNDSNLTRNLEMPLNKFDRKYEVRIYGNLDLKELNKKSKGSIINNINYKPFSFKIKSKIKKNTILEISLKEGKKNEIREIFKSLNLQVNKLKRVSFGPFGLDKMKVGQIKKVSNLELRNYENHIRNQKR